MWMLKKHRRKEAEIQAIRKDLFKTAQETERSVKRLNTLLEDPELGVSGLIFYAMGGDGRTKKGKK